LRTLEPLTGEQIFDSRIITFFHTSFQLPRLIYSLVPPYTVSYNPHTQARWFGLFPFRSPLLRESLFLSLPAGTKISPFSASTYDTLCIYVSIIRHNSYWVPPFGNLWITAYLQLPKAYRR